MYRVYKSLVTKWNPNRNPSNKVEAEAEAKFQEINEPFKVSHIYIYIYLNIVCMCTTAYIL
jgi:hypothetical protein